MKYNDLPDDMQVLLEEIFDQILDGELIVRSIPLSAFPHIILDPNDYRKLDWYMGPTILKKLPPIVLVQNYWIDGIHRVLAARHLGQDTIKTINLTEIGIRPEQVPTCNIIGQLAA
jgi:hypothetical protein